MGLGEEQFKLKELNAKMEKVQSILTKINGMSGYDLLFDIEQHPANYEGIVRPFLRDFESELKSIGNKNINDYYREKEARYGSLYSANNIISSLKFKRQQLIKEIGYAEYKINQFRERNQ